MGITITIIVVAVLIVLGHSIITLVRLPIRRENSWSQISVQLQRRYDLFRSGPKRKVHGYARDLEAVVKARSAAVAAKNRLEQGGGPTGENAGSMKDLLAAEGTLRGALGNLFALAENYPQLRASETMGAYKKAQLTENKIAFARQAYNDQAMAYNIARNKHFPVIFLLRPLAITLPSFMMLKIRKPEKL